MFNVYQYDKEFDEQQKEIVLETKLKNMKCIRKVKSEMLAKRYNDRVSHFMNTVIVNPVKVDNYNDPSKILPRPCDPSKFKGGSSFILKGFKTEKQRIQESLENNQILDTSPIMTGFEFRKRDRSKELARTRKKVVKKIVEPVSNTTTNNGLEDEEISDTLSKASSATYTSKKKEYTFSQIPVNINRTYFKAVTQQMIRDLGSKKTVVPDKNEFGIVNRLSLTTIQPFMYLLGKNKYVNKTI